jgi:Ser-tRNA(Ala) deacylase AlaX
MTTTLYLEHPYQREFNAVVLESLDEWCTLSQTVFYPGGGGLPHDRGHPIVHGEAVAISTIREDAASRIWHFAGCNRMVRTLNVLPPVVNGTVRIVEIDGFDAQARGAPHVRSTSEIGRRASINSRTKGKTTNDSIGSGRYDG